MLDLHRHHLIASIELRGGSRLYRLKDQPVRKGRAGLDPLDCQTPHSLCHDMGHPSEEG